MSDILEIKDILGSTPRTSLMKVPVYVALLITLYYSAISWLLHDWMREDYSHSFLIPFVVLYLIWDKRADLISTPARPTWGGLVALIPGLVMYWLGELGGEFFTLYISLWLVILGLSWLHMGWNKLKVIGFAMFMLLAMFPLPNLINVKLTTGLKLISS